MHRMGMRFREQYLKALLGRYLRARKRRESALLDEYLTFAGDEPEDGAVESIAMKPGRDRDE